MWALSAALCALWALGEARQAPRPHPAVVQALAPKGLRVSLPDESGMDLAVIHASVNVPLALKEPGQVSATVAQADGGFWTLSAPELQLKKGDAVFYWAYVSVLGVGRNVTGHHIIGGLVEPSCAPSVTTVNGQPACRGALVFEDNFDTFNTSIWKHNVQYSASEDLEFCTYTDDPANSFARDGALHLKSTIVEDVDELTTPAKLDNCTNPRDDFCERKPFSWYILPPAHSVWLTTEKTFSFLYGRLEVRAKVAAGDWLLSYVYLEPRARVYGRGYAQSGRIDVVRTRGNALFQERNDPRSWGARHNVMRTVVATCNLVYFNHGYYNLPAGLFSDGFHVFGLTWTPHQLRFTVDGKEAKLVRPPPGGRLEERHYKRCEGSPWEKGTAAAPFDREFFFYLMLKVAGFYDFREGSKSGEHVKPWKNKNPRAPLDFWQARNEFLPTWKSDFEIDYIKVWAL